MITKRTYECFLFHRLPGSPPSCLFTGRGTGREARKQTPADRQLGDVAFYGMMDWPYRWPFWQSWQTEEEDLIWVLFWFPQTSYLRAIWEESSPRRNVQRGDNTLWLQVIISPLSRLTHLCTNSCICHHGYFLNCSHAKVACWSVYPLLYFVHSSIILWL